MTAVAATEPVVNVSLAAKQYVGAGLILVAFDRGAKGKGPQHKGWNKRENCITTLDQASNLYGNIGVALLYSRLVSLDIDNMPFAISWFAGVGIDLQAYWDAANAVRMTSGRPNRGKIFYRMPDHIALLITRMFKGEGIELRCATAGGLTVQDVLPPSVHPVTGEPYRWMGPGSWRNIPQMPADLLAFWLTLMEPKTRSASGGETPSGMGREDIEESLGPIKPEAQGYDDWLHVGMALHHETSGDHVGLDIWDNWSASDGKNAKYNRYGRAELETKWAGFRLGLENPITLRTIAYLGGVVDMSGEYEVLPELPPAIESRNPEPKRTILRVKPVDLDALTGTPPPPDVIVENLLLMDACGFVAPGGTGKTTLAIFEAIHIILGRPLWGRQICKPGRVLFLTAEDSRQIVETRLNLICKSLDLTAIDLSIVADGFYIEDLSMVGMRLVGTAPDGAIRATKLVADIVGQYRDLDVSLVHLDPASLLGPGEQSGNDGMSELMRAARQIAGDVRAACQIVHHVAQVVARNGIQDQYAGRGGTAFADNSRGQRQLVRIKERAYEFDGRRYRMPDEITDDHLTEGDVLAILVHKLSYVKLDPRPIFILRRGYGFTQFEAGATAGKVTRTVDEETQVLVGFLTRQHAAGVTHSARSLGTLSVEIGLGQKRIRDLVNAGLDQGVFEWSARTKSGGKQRHLVVAEELPNDL